MNVGSAQESGRRSGAVIEPGYSNNRTPKACANVRTRSILRYGSPLGCDRIGLHAVLTGKVGGSAANFEGPEES